MRQPALFDAILSRHSVRRFEPTPLDGTVRSRLEAIVDDVKPLVPERTWGTQLLSVAPDGATLAALGA